MFTKDKDVSELFNICFGDAVHKLDIQENVYLLNQTNSTNDPVESAIETYDSQPSILKIKEKVTVSVFNFKDACLEDVEKELKSLNTKKATTFKNIPSKLLKQQSDIW